MRILSPVRNTKNITSLAIVSNGVRDTLNIGKAIARSAQKGDIICLFGPLGSGKTILAKGVAIGLGIKKEAVISPTFVLLRQYDKAKLPFFHFDLYRLTTQSQILALGYEEYLYDDALTVIEWADRLKSLLPQEYLKIKLSLKAGSRRVLEFSAWGRRYQELLAKLNANIRS